MKKFILTIFFLLFLSACSESSLSIDSNDRLILINNDKEHRISERSISSELLRYPNFEVKRSKLVNSFDRVLFFEQIITEHDYELKYNALDSLKYGFKVSKSNTVYKEGNLLFVQLQLKNDKYINLIVESSITTELSYIYGFTNREFIEILEALDIKKYSKNLKFVESISAYKTEWNRVELLLHPLTESTPGWGAK